jgi:phosphoserine phosphatase RsbU/P
VTRESSTALRLHVEELPDEPPSLPSALLSPLTGALVQVTGWHLAIEQSPAALGEFWSMAIGDHDQPAGRLVLAPASDQARSSAIDFQQVRPLALAIGGLLSEINRLQHAVRRREAELAAGVPVASGREGEPHLAERLEAVLKAGAQAVGCQAAGLYLLDDATTELKLRAAWGLSQEKLLAAGRPLRGSVADLEALVGHAVVLEDTSLLPHWRCPEDFPAAICVPVSSPSIPLGTLWAFCDRTRDFTPEESNLLEIIAGRLAADLEREMLLAAGSQAKAHDKQFEAAARWQRDRLPSIAPLVDGYEIAGWTTQSNELGGDFHDWSVLPDGRVALAVGDADGTPLEAALGAASLHAALKAHATATHDAGELFTRLNETLIAASPGDQRAALAYLLLEPDTGCTQLALAGGAAAILVRPDSRLVTTSDAPQLGGHHQATFEQDKFVVRPDDVLVLISPGVRRAVDAAGLRIGEVSLTNLLASHLRDSADSLVRRLRHLLEQSSQVADDMTVVVLKRKR